MGTDLSKCGQRGYDSRGCKLENFKECSDLQGFEFLGLGVRRGRVQVADESKRQGNPTLQQIKKLNWSNFKMYEGLCYKRLTDKPRGKVSWSLYRHSAAIPAAVPAVSGTDTASDEGKGLIDEIWGPIEKGLELAMKGKFDKAMEEVGIERVAGLAVTGLLGIVILVSLARLPFKVARKNKEKRVEAERQDVARGKREAAARVEREREAEVRKQTLIAADARRRAVEAEQRAAQAEGAVQEALRMAQEIAATRELTPMPRRLSMEETPLPLMQEKLIEVEPEMESSAGRADDATDPQVVTMARANVDFAIIDTVLRIAMEEEGKALLEIEQKTEIGIGMAEVKRAAAIAWHHPVKGKTHLETTTQLLAIGAGAFEKGESLTGSTLRRTAEYLSQNEVGGKAIERSLTPYDDWIASNEYETEAFRDHRRVMSARLTVVPGVEVTPTSGVVTPEPPTRQVDLRRDGTPAKRGKVGTELTGLPQRAQSVTTDVDPEMLKVEQKRLGAAAPEFMFVDDRHRHDPNETKFSPDQIEEIEKAIEFAPEGSLPLAGPVDDRHHDPSSVMRDARFVLDKESERFGNPNDKMKIEIANRFSDAVKQVPGFAKMYYKGGKGREIDREGLKVVADLVRFMKEDAHYSGLGNEGRTIAERQYLTGFLASEEVQGRYFELEGKVDLVGMTSAREALEGRGARPKRGGARPAGRADERRKRERSDRYIDPFAEDSELKKLAKDVGNKYGKKK